MVALVAALALAAPAALAGDEPAGGALAEGRFVDVCLGRPAEAEALYQKALAGEPKLGAKERAEAEFAIARARALEGRKESAAALLGRLAERSGDEALGSWPARAREALDRLVAGGDPFRPEPRGSEPLSVQATAKPLVAVLREIGAKTGVSFAFDPSVPATWTVSAFLEDLPLDPLLDKLIGTGRWRRVGDGVAIGDLAADGYAWERRWGWEDVRDPAGRALGARLCTTRASLVFPGISLGQALEKINALGVCEASVPPMYEDGEVRLYAKDLRLDTAFDLLAVPLGLTWVIRDGKVVFQVRKEHDDR